MGNFAAVPSGGQQVCLSTAAVGTPTVALPSPQMTEREWNMQLGSPRRLPFSLGYFWHYWGTGDPLALLGDWGPTCVATSDGRGGDKAAKHDQELLPNQLGHFGSRAFGESCYRYLSRGVCTQNLLMRPRHLGPRMHTKHRARWRARALPSRVLGYWRRTPTYKITSVKRCNRSFQSSSRVCMWRQPRESADGLRPNERPSQEAGNL